MTQHSNLSKTNIYFSAFLNFQISLFHQKQRKIMQRANKRGRAVILVLIALITSSAATPKKVQPTQICQNLTKEFDRNEAKMALINDVNRLLFEAAKKFSDAVNDQRSRSDALQALRKISTDDEINLVASDRIVTLILANKCTPPDHVANWFTYSETNPNRKLPPE